MKRYRCHKVVEAARIVVVRHQTIDLEGEPDVVAVGVAWINRHQPQVGGYFVRYEDGYTSYSPAAAFEAGYTRIEEPSA